jgi:hypothetical protein
MEARTPISLGHSPAAEAYFHQAADHILDDRVNELEGIIGVLHKELHEIREKNSKESQATDIFSHRTARLQGYSEHLHSVIEYLGKSLNEKDKALAKFTKEAFKEYGLQKPKTPKSEKSATPNGGYSQLKRQIERLEWNEQSLQAEILELKKENLELKEKIFIIECQTAKENETRKLRLEHSHKLKLRRFFMDTVNDQLLWAFSSWKTFSAKAGHEAEVHALVCRRVKSALERRFMFSVRDQAIWAFRTWKDFCIHSNHEDSIRRLVEEQAAAHHEQIREKVRRALERRFMYTVRDQISWAFRTWKGIMHSTIVHEHAAYAKALMDQQVSSLKDQLLRRVKSTLERCIVSSLAGHLSGAFKLWKDFTYRRMKDELIGLLGERGESLRQEARKRVRNALERKFMSSVREKMFWALNTWKIFILRANQILKLREHVTGKFKIALERRYMAIVRNNVASAFNQWRLESTKSFYEVELKYQIAMRCMRFLLRQYLFHCKEKIVHAFHRWKYIAARSAHDSYVKSLADEHSAMMRYLRGQMSVILKRNYA